MDLHKLQIFSIHSPTHVHNTRTQTFVEVLESLTYCIEVLFKKKKRKEKSRLTGLSGSLGLAISRVIG